MLPTTSSWKPKIAKIWSKSQTAADWRLPFALFVCALLAYGGAFAWHMLTTFDLVNILRDVNTEDSFYYFQIAYNLAQGKFSTFDGGITQTNGYHPVWLLLITPFYWVFDKETALFGIKAFEIMLVAGGVALIALAAWLSRLSWLLLFAALPMLYRKPPELLLGLEAAAAMFALTLLILAVCVYMRDPPRWKWHLFTIAFALPWVRIEYIAVSFAVTAALCAIEWSRLERRSLRLSALAAVRDAYIPPIGAIAGMLAYFAYNRLVFGGFVPVSAATWREWAQDRWVGQGGYSLIESLQGALRYDVFDYELLFALEICVYLLIAWRLALRSKERRDWLLVAFLVGVFGLAAGHIAKFAQVVLISHPDYGDKIWHFVPAYLMTALIIPIRLYVAIWLIRRFLAPRRRAAANVLGIAIFIIGAAFLFGISGFAEPFRWVERMSVSSRHDWAITSYMGAQVMNRALPEGSVIGSRDSDVIGYFSRFPVVNLDGLVNSYEFFNIANRDSHAIGQSWLAMENNRSLSDTQVAKTIRRYGVTHFANIRWRDQSPNNVIFRGVPFDSWDGQRQFNIWPHDHSLSPSDKDRIHHSHQVWDNLKPHFNYLSDGVGVLFAGRTAQAFVKDCALDETLAWTWQERRHDRSVRLAINPYRSRANMCIDARVLPRGARQSAQVKLIKPSNAYFTNLPNLPKSLEPIIRSDFDVYIADRSLIYTKPQCSDSDVAERFFASIIPVDAANLPAYARENGYYIIDFKFDEYGAIAADGRCWAEVALPNYPITEIHAGQYAVVEDDYRYLWEGNAYPIGLGMAADFEKLADREPIIRSEFDAHIIGGSLIYAKERCAEEDVEAKFFVSVFPLYSDDLSASVGQGGYEPLDFDFRRYGAISDGGCWAKIALPNYPIAKIHTGQYVAVGDGYHYPWEAVYHFHE